MFKDFIRAAGADYEGVFMQLFLYTAGLAVMVLLAIEDLRFLKLNMPVIWLMSLTAVVLRIISQEDIWSILLSFIPGLLLILISGITRGTVGLGDGFAVMMVGACLDFFRTVGVVSVSLILLSVGALVMLIFKKAGRKTIVPYMPWLLGPYILGGVLK